MKKLLSLLSLLFLLSLPVMAHAYLLAAMLGSGSTGTVYAPNAPTMTASPGNAQITYTWSAPATDASHSAATSYNLRYGTVSGTLSTTVTGVSSPYVLTGLINNNTYYAKLDAINSGGTTSQASEVAATPTAGSFAAFTDAFTGSNGASFNSTNWGAVAGAQSYGATHTATIQNNAASLSGNASSSTAYGGVVVPTAGQIGFSNGRYVQLDFVTGRNPTNTYSRIYVVGANTTYANGIPATNFLYITYNAGGNINIAPYDGSGNTPGEVTFGSTYTGTQTVKVVFTDATHFVVYVGGTQVGSTYAHSISWGSTIGMMLGVIGYGTANVTYVYDNVSLQ